MALLLNHPKFRDEWDLLMMMPKDGSSDYKGQLQLCQKVAIEVAPSKEERQRRHQELERKQRADKEARKARNFQLATTPSGRGRSGAAGPPLTGAGPSASASHRHQMALTNKRGRSDSTDASSSSSTFGRTAAPPQKSVQMTSGVSVHDRLGARPKHQKQRDETEVAKANYQKQKPKAMSSGDIRQGVTTEVHVGAEKVSKHRWQRGKLEAEEDAEQEELTEHELDLFEEDMEGLGLRESDDNDNGGEFDNDASAIARKEQAPSDKDLLLGLAPYPTVGPAGLNKQVALPPPAGSYAAAAKPVCENRILVSVGEDGSVPFSKDMWKKFETRLGDAVRTQQKVLTEKPILIDDMWFFGGRVSIDAADPLSRSKIIDLIHGKEGNKPITANGHKFLAVHYAEVDPTASITLRIEAAGPVAELISGQHRGLARLNGWSDLGQTPFRVLSVEDNTSNAGSRFVRVAATRPAIDAIKQKQGVVYCGERRASVHYKNKQLTSDVEVDYNHS